MNVLEFKKMKDEGRTISMVTCYDYWSANIIENTDIDCVLVGDSLAMVMHGHDSTLPATTELMALHIEAVRKGMPSKFIVGDMPFLSVRKGLEAAMLAVDTLMKAGANAIKVEEVDGHEDVIQFVVDSGVPVMGHLGLTPQSVNKFGGFKVQGKSDAAAKDIMRKARKLEELGAFSIVLECVPSALAQEITKSLSIPTIGIGAGPDVDGQVLVLHDLLGMSNQFKPKFLRQYINGFSMIQESLNQFDKDVKAHEFPNEKESYK